VSLLSRVDLLRPPGSDSRFRWTSKHALCPAPSASLLRNFAPVLLVCSSSTHEVNVMSLLITVIVITGFVLGHKIARYLGV